jgi:hypothetical protein
MYFSGPAHNLSVSAALAGQVIGLDITAPLAVVFSLQLSADCAKHPVESASVRRAIPKT